MKILTLTLVIFAALFNTACKNDLKRPAVTPAATAETQLPSASRWEANDIFAGRVPHIPRELWPGIGPLDGGLEAKNMGGKLDSVFLLQKVETEESVITFMERLAREGKFIADPFQVEQFAAATGWKIEQGTISSSRTLRYFCQTSEPCIPPVIFEYQEDGRWVEKNTEVKRLKYGSTSITYHWISRPHLRPGSFILLCQPKPGAKASIPKPEPAEPGKMVKVYHGNPRFVGAGVKLVSSEGVESQARFSSSALKYRERLAENHEIRIESPGNLRKDAKLIVIERNGRETVFSFPVLTYRSGERVSLCLLITGCVAGNIPRIFNNSTDRFTWPDGYEPPAKLPQGCED